MQGSTVLCHNHSTKSCELHCEQCDSPICARCISSGKHEHHKKNDIWKKMENNKAEIHKFLQELEESFYQNMKQLRLTSLIKKLISRKTHGN